MNKAYGIFFCSKTYFSAKKKVVAATFAKYYFDILKTLSVKTVHFTVGSTVFTQHSIKTVFVVFYVFLLMCPNTIKAKKKWIEGVLFPTICSCIKTVTKWYRDWPIFKAIPRKFLSVTNLAISTYN